MRRTLALTLGVLITVVATACTQRDSDQGPQGLAASTNVTQPIDPDAASGPAVTDDHIVGPYDLPLESHYIDIAVYGVVVDTVVAECMTENKWVYPASVLDLGASEPSAYSRLGYHALTEDSANRLGYRDEEDRRVIRPEKFPTLSSDEEERYKGQLDSCVEHSKEVVPDFAVPGNEILQLDLESREIAAKSAAVEEANVQWSQCMRRAGVETDLEEVPKDLAGTPEGFRIGMIQGLDAKHRRGDLSTMIDTPTEDEIDIALHDLACRERVGFDRVYFGAVGEAQAHLMGANPAAVADIERTVSEIKESVKSNLSSVRKAK